MGLSGGNRTAIAAEGLAADVKGAKAEAGVRVGIPMAMAFLFGTAVVAQGQAPAGTAAAAPSATRDKEEKCKVSGLVVKLADGAPLKNATVSLYNDGEQDRRTIATRTGNDGRFALKNIPAGRYRLYVSRNGYLATQYGQKKAGDPGAGLSLSPGQAKELLFKLIPAAVISGRVFNEDGEPEPGVQVTALRERYEEGKRTITAVAQVQTDDLGAFRLFDLSPGRYFVGASLEAGKETHGEREFIENASASEQSYVQTYYPGTTDLGRAAAVSVKEGEQAPGVDIALRKQTVHRVRGRVINQFTNNPDRYTMVQLISRSTQRWEFEGSTGAKDDGSFELANVAPGPYTLVANWRDLSGAGKTYTASQRLEVGENDVEGVSLVIETGTTLQGKIVWEGKPNEPRVILSVHAMPVETDALGASGRVDEKGQFTLKDLPDGATRLDVYGATRDCYVKEIVSGQTLAKDSVVRIAKGANPAIEITISTRAARVQGAVTDPDGLPAAGVWVVAIPEEAKRANFRLFKSQSTDQNGKFDLHGLAPGSYKLFSWSEVEKEEWEDPEFLKAFEGKGEAVEVVEGDVKTVNLKVLEKKSERE